MIFSRNRPTEAQLNLQEAQIFGWEIDKPKDPIVIWSMILGIRGASEFPLVNVHPVGDQEQSFHINRTRPDPYVRGSRKGGHNRVLAHLIEDAPLGVLLEPKTIALKQDSKDVRLAVVDYIEPVEGETDQQKYNRDKKNAELEDVIGIKPYTSIPSDADLAYMQERMSVLRGSI